MYNDTIYVSISILHNISIHIIVSRNLIKKICDTFHCYIQSEATAYDLSVLCLDDVIQILRPDNTLIYTGNEWMFHLVTALEDIAVYRYHNSVFHGSAVSFGEQHAIAFVGSSGSGKTTIAEIVCNYHKCAPFSDDLLMLDGNKLHQILLPAKIKPKDRQLGEITFKRIDTTMSGKLDLTAIVSVKYDSSSASERFERMDVRRSVSILIKNSRKAVSNRELFKHIAYISKNIPIYELSYRNNTFAVSCIQNLCC